MNGLIEATPTTNDVQAGQVLASRPRMTRRDWFVALASAVDVVLLTYVAPAVWILGGHAWWV